MSVPAVGKLYSFDFVGGAIHDPDYYPNGGAMYWGTNAKGEHVFGNAFKPLAQNDGITSILFYVFKSIPRNIKQVVRVGRADEMDPTPYLPWFQSGELDLPQLPAGYSRSHTYTEVVKVPILAAGGLQVVGEKPMRMILVGGAVFARETPTGFERM